MPKRSNEFQEFVAVVERLTASPTASVVESSMLLDPPAGVEREIDVVIDEIIDAVPMRVALECRDHKRPQDVTWIDALIGRFQRMEVDEVIAVSSSGFTDAAIKKAHNFGIKTYTIREALEEDARNGLFPRPFVSFGEIEPMLAGVDVRFADGEIPLPPGTDYAEWTIENPRAQKSETVFRAAQRLFASNHRAAIWHHLVSIEAGRGKGPRTSEFDFFAQYTIESRYLVAPDGVRRRLTEFHIRIKGRVVFTDATHRHLDYEKKRATVARVTDSAGGKHKLTLVRLNDEPPTALKWHYAGSGMEIGKTKKSEKLPKKTTKKTAKKKRKK
ncbi:MAG: restriction endonuclease [Gemmatimonadota bacterium]|nr:restriction endonuclease [Gemmatimonadota bacterium]